MMMINDYHYHNDHDDFYSCGWLQNAMQCLEMRNMFVNDCQCFEMYETLCNNWFSCISKCLTMIVNVLKCLK